MNSDQSNLSGSKTLNIASLCQRYNISTYGVIHIGAH